MANRMFGVWISAVLLAAAPGWAAAQEGHHEHADAGHEHEAGAQTITGEVVDLACYLGHGALGEGHRDCAEKCIASGLPVGIRSGDRIYLAVSSEHGTANAALAPLAAQQVTVEGTVTERDGVHLITIRKRKVSAAKKD